MWACVVCVHQPCVCGRVCASTLYVSVCVHVCVCLSTGINRVRVEDMEVRLKVDILTEAARFTNRILVLHENEDLSLYDHWEVRLCVCLCAYVHMRACVRVCVCVREREFVQACKSCLLAFAW